ncbi:hypothetical protein VTK73DRAFT_2264 [Phialemonium thermophilum]|uniref:JmjC domain-containing protein n=1 Tax=Phialemonium thermophilum TaxID=223376 RepID=A0ABR3VSJ8_9PEZI
MQLAASCQILWLGLVEYQLMWREQRENGSSHEKTSSFTWRGSWRSTLLDLPKDKRAAVDCSNVYSDVLHRPFVCSHIALDGYASSIPRGNEIRRFENLTYDEFARDWSDRPFILTKCTQDWPASRSWNLDELLRRYGDVEFRAEAVDWAFSTYYAYLRDNDDESPLYLFDRRFAEKMGISVGRGPDEQGGKFAYWNPECFGTDLFEVLGAERPAHRWLIAGPARSGSTFHKDPNGTSAWNAVVQGAKYWILFPPSAAVPGVYESRDGGEVTSPLSIAEWLLSFHAEARRTPGCVEGVCRAGEMVHVPSGWWHLVVNLEAGVAITQNFVPAAHLAEVLGFLRDRADQTSGFKREVADPYGLFVERLRERHPQLLEAALEELEARRSRRKKRRWEAVAGGSDAEEGGPTKSSAFCFGFAEDDEEVP